MFEVVKGGGGGGLVNETVVVEEEDSRGRRCSVIDGENTLCDLMRELGHLFQFAHVYLMSTSNVCTKLLCKKRTRRIP